MKRKTQGNYETVSTIKEIVKAFVPSPLPPVPDIVWTHELREKFDRAHMAMGKLDSISTLLPDPHLFIYMFVRKEAVLSSQIEGTQTSLSDLLLFELDEKIKIPLDDVKEVCNYISALNYGLEKIREGFPISSRLIKEMHEKLLQKGRGSELNPGEFRKTQNWIGGTRPGNAFYVPPPAHKISECMKDLDNFINNIPVKTSTLLKAALTHVQFETIHPFLDGNGRIGRLLIILLLCSENVIVEPVLYLSLYFKTHRTKYYELLNDVRIYGEWENWLEFFADAVHETATQTFKTAQKMIEISNRHKKEILKLGAVSDSVLKVHHILMKHLIINAKFIKKNSEISLATVNKCLNILEEMNIIIETTKQKRNKIYCYIDYVNIINEGTEI